MEGAWRTPGPGHVDGSALSDERGRALVLAGAPAGVGKVDLLRLNLNEAEAIIGGGQNDLGPCR
jgi:hypothetical protein